MALIDTKLIPSSSAKYKKVLFTAFSPKPESEAMALYNYLKQQGVDEIHTFYWGGNEVKKKIPSDVHTIEIAGNGQFEPEQVQGYDVVFRHTTTNPKLLIGVNSSTATKVFFENCKAPILGVTGTKGKGTTSTLIYEILKRAVGGVHLVGNIGRPAIAELDKISPNDLVVFELSSFQLWDLHQSPHIGVILMMEPEHLDVHDSLDDYINAKANIARWQTPNDSIYYHPTNKLSQKAASVGLGKKYKYLTKDSAYINGAKLMIENTEICDVNDIKIPGKHNYENIAAAVSVAWSFTQDPELIKDAIINYEGIEHRLKLVAEVDGVKYFDDSAATTPSATIAAIASFKEPKIIILGGSDKGTTYNELTKAIANDPSVKKVIAIGQTGPIISEQLKRLDYRNINLIQGNAEDAVKLARQLAEPGDIVLLSPASASFDMYKNYNDRGDRFRQAVELWKS